MFYIVLSLHVFLCVAIITLVLLQQGKGASAGAVLGGSSNTLFGASGANTVLTKVTTGFAIAFMLTSIALVHLYSSHAASRTISTNSLEGSVMEGRVVAAPVVPDAAAPAPSSVAVDKAPAGDVAGAADVAAPIAAASSSVPAVPASVPAAASDEKAPASAASSEGRVE